MGETGIHNDDMTLQSARSRKFWVGAAILSAFALLGVAGSCVACEYALSDTRDVEWESITIPVGQARSFQFRRRSSHPFFAEYVRFIDFANGSAHELRRHTGGRPFINVYQYDAADPNLILLLDDQGGYQLDMDTGQVLSQAWPREVLKTFNHAPERFIGRIEGYTGDLRFVPAETEGEFAIPDLADPWGRKLPLPPGPSGAGPATKSNNQ